MIAWHASNLCTPVHKWFVANQATVTLKPVGRPCYGPRGKKVSQGFNGNHQPPNYLQSVDVDVVVIVVIVVIVVHDSKYFCDMTR
jgi:hypothetical protein